jgi:hypothetical protein
MEVVNQDYVEYLQTLFQSLEPIYRFTFSPNTDSDAPYIEEDISTFGTHEQGRVTFYSKEYGECEKGIVNFVMDYWVMDYNDEPSVITAIHISSHFGDTEIELDNCFLPNQEKFKFFMENALDYVAHELYWTKQGEKDIRIMKAVL